MELLEKWEDGRDGRIWMEQGIWMEVGNEIVNE